MVSDTARYAVVRVTGQFLEEFCARKGPDGRQMSHPDVLLDHNKGSLGNGVFPKR